MLFRVCKATLGLTNVLYMGPNYYSDLRLRCKMGLDSPQDMLSYPCSLERSIPVRTWGCTAFVP